MCDAQENGGKKMSKVSIVYWSGTGNTQKMAEAVAEGVKEAGAEVDLKFVSAASVDELAAEPAFALGCPSMGAEELEDKPPPLCLCLPARSVPRPAST